MGEFIMYLIAFNQTHSTFKISTNEKQFNFKCTIWCSLSSKCLSSISLQNYSLKRKHLYFVHVVLFIQDFLQDLILIKIFCDDIWNWHTHTHFFLMDKCMHVTHGVNVFIEFSVLVFTKTVFIFFKSMLCFLS